MKKQLLIIGIPIIGWTLLMSPWLWKMPVHNMKLYAFQQNFDRLSHPQHSRLVAEIREFGNFGNSNHCDYFVGEFRESTESREAIVDHYSNQHTSPPDESQGVWSGPPPTKTDVEVYFLNDDVFEHWPWSDWLRKFVSQLPKDRENIYLVFALESGYPPVGDLRCH